jgi:UDP-2-acetamido-2,6-beta-L-arabino-hexul-4-ose reductase
VISGKVEFCFRALFDNSQFNFVVDSKSNHLVDAIPGYWHSLENVGHDEAVVLVWTNENFDQDFPDTYRWNWS